MGVFAKHGDEAEREATRRHQDAQQRLADARLHQQERHSASTTTGTRHVGYPEGSWRKEFDLYVVRKGDTLFGISRQVYGDGNSWHRIQQANPIVLKDPDILHAGLVLRIPKGDGPPLA